MLFDSGSAVNCVSKQTYDKYFLHSIVSEDEIILKGYNGSIFRPLGYFIVCLKYNCIVKPTKFYVISNGGPSILGREWIKNFGLKLQLVSIIARVGGGSDGGAGFTQANNPDRENIAKKLTQKYPEVFSDKIGRYRYSRVPLFLKPYTKPVFCRLRPVPWAYKEEMEKELDRMVKENILTPVQSSDWATPLVVIVKENGKLRLCGDYKSTVNRYLTRTFVHFQRMMKYFQSFITESTLRNSICQMRTTNLSWRMAQKKY